MDNINEFLSKLTSEEQAELLKHLNDRSETEKANSESILGHVSLEDANPVASVKQKVNTSVQEGHRELTREEKISMAPHGSRTITQREPLIMFIGPASCGKSMVLMSLVDYLQSLPNSKYSISPNKSYILNDPDYITNCNKFMGALELNAGNNVKIPLDKTVDEVLLDVRENKIRKYTMLEAPGEDFFDIGNPNTPYRKYIKKIIQDCTCPIYFVMLLDLHTPNNNFHDENDSVRVAYERRLGQIIDDGFCKKRGDRIIFLYNKFDLHDDAITDQRAMEMLFRTYYKNIKNNNNLYRTVLGERLYPYFETLPYISGIYGETEPDNEGRIYEIYQINQRVTDTVKALWNKLK